MHECGKIGIATSVFVFRIGMPIRNYMERKMSTKTNKTKMSTEEKTYVILMIAVMVLFGYLIWYDYGTKVVEDADTIIWLESSNPTTCEDVKEEISNIVKENRGEEPTKVAFMVGGGNYQTCTYKVRVYYKLANQKWYTFKMSWIDFRISPELDKRLSDIYRTCN